MKALLCVVRSAFREVFCSFKDLVVCLFFVVCFCFSLFPHWDLLQLKGPEKEGPACIPRDAQQEVAQGQQAALLQGFLSAKGETLSSP